MLPSVLDHPMLSDRFYSGELLVRAKPSHALGLGLCVSLAIARDGVLNMVRRIGVQEITAEKENWEITKRNKFWNLNKRCAIVPLHLST